MENGCGASQENHKRIHKRIPQNSWQNKIPLPWGSIPGQLYPLMAVTEQFWRCCVYKGILEGVCGGLHWFLPSLLFYHSFPSADSETWLNNLIPWWQMQMKKDRYLDPVPVWPWRRWLHYCYWMNFWFPHGRFLPPIYPQKPHRWHRRERWMCKIQR